MVHGNVLALTVRHWLIASQTGLLAGAITAIAILVSKATRPWIISTLFGLITAGADYFMHPGMLGPFLSEALITGLAAGLLSYVAPVLLRCWAAKRELVLNQPRD